jgi:predicted nucleotide-binding protein (sugar kinase/HSP70/actin superfamily)
MTTRRVCFPLLGSYYIPEKTLGRLVGDEVIVPPRMTKKTLEIGAKHSPESVCIPFKYMLGNFIEALEKGANVLFQIGGGCRLGCYGEIQRAILQKLGYEFEFIKMTNSHNLVSIGWFVKKLYPQLSYLHIAEAFYRAYEQAKAIDEFEDYVRKNIGFEVEQGSFERLHKRFLSALDHTTGLREIWKVKRTFLEEAHLLKVEKPEKPLRVGFVGEFYVVLEPFSNFFIEKQLARYGIEVHRPLNIADTVHHYIFYDRHIRHLLADAAPYLHNAIGAHGTESVAQAVRFAKRGFDGLIHVKPFGCMPEINAMPALHRVSEDFRFPILYFSFDALTSETGIKTRLEAFYDMLVMREAKNGQAA